MGSERGVQRKNYRLGVSGKMILNVVVPTTVLLLFAGSACNGFGDQYGLGSEEHGY